MKTMKHETEDEFHRKIERFTLFLYQKYIALLLIMLISGHLSLRFPLTVAINLACEFIYNVKTMLPTIKECNRRRNGTFLSSKSKHRPVLHAEDQTKTKHMLETDAVTKPSAKSKWSSREGGRIAKLGFLVINSNMAV